MQLITTTELRTKSKELIETLDGGQIVELVHRSRIVGEIKPKKQIVKFFNFKRFGGITRRMNLPKLTYEERATNYRKAMEKKHG